MKIYLGILFLLVLPMGCSPHSSDIWPDTPKALTTPDPSESIDLAEWERTKQNEAELWEQINAPTPTPSV